MGQNSAMWGREAEFQCGDEEKGEFCEFFRRSVDNFHQNEVGGGRGHDIYRTLLLSPASEARRSRKWHFSAKFFFSHFVAEGGGSPPTGTHRTIRRGMGVPPPVHDRGKFFRFGGPGGEAPREILAPQAKIWKITS